MIKKKYLIYILCFLLIASAFALSSCYLTLKRGLDSGRRIVVAGVVVDDEGRPMSGVKMEVMRYKSSPLRYLLDKNSHQNVVSDNEVDESFKIDVDDASSVTLEFSRVGYFIKKFSLPSDAEVDRDGRISDMRIVLQKKQATVPLGLLDGRLTFAADGSGVLLDMAKLVEYQKVDQSKNLHTYEYFLPYAKYEDAVLNQPHGLALFSDKVKDGEIVSVTLKMPGPFERLFPENIQMKVLNDADGIQIYKKQPWMRSSIDVVRAMSLAPADGYVKTIEIRPEDMLDEIYVYFRIDGHYGKIRFQDIGVKKDRKSINAFGRIFIQPVAGERALAEERLF